MALTGHRVCVTGGGGFLGTAVVDRLMRSGVPEVHVPRSAEYDLRDRDDAVAMFQAIRPTIVIHLAATVGGIGANSRRPGQFFYDNLSMGLNLIELCRIEGVHRVVMVGTVCSYPSGLLPPFREKDLWIGYPEPTNAPYGIAKKALGAMLEAYFEQYALPSAYLIPANLYGPGDSDDQAKAHVIPELMRKFFTAAEKSQPSVKLWGTGRPTRDFLYVDDAAEAIVRAADLVDVPDPINLGTGVETSIRELAERISLLAGYGGRVEWDLTMPDGQNRRAVDSSIAAGVLGWHHQTDLEQGLRQTWDAYSLDRAKRAR